MVRRPKLFKLLWVLTLVDIFTLLGLSPFMDWNGRIAGLNRTVSSIWLYSILATGISTAIWLVVLPGQTRSSRFLAVVVVAVYLMTVLVLAGRVG
jgi:hypothetical protein